MHIFRNAKDIFEQGAYLLWTSGPDVQKDVVPASEQNVCGNVINVGDIEAHCLILTENEPQNANKSPSLGRAWWPSPVRSP